MATALTSRRHRDGALFALGAHSDDLALSLGAAWWDGRLAGWRPVTVFSRSGFTLRVPNGDVTGTSALRAAEDRAFFSRTTAGALLWLDQPDAPIRRELHSETVFSAPVHAHELAAVRAGLEAVLPLSGTLFAPLAIGGHVDHRIVCGVACELFRQGGYDIIFYEDLPYAAFMAMPAIADAVRHVEQMIGTALFPRYWASASLAKAKQWAVESYASQTDRGTLPSLLYHARRLAQDGVGTERVWATARRGRG